MTPIEVSQRGVLDMPRPVSIGIDLGQVRDPTAIVVVEQAGDFRLATRELEATVRYTARGVERLPLGTAYQLVAQRIVEIISIIEERDRRDGLVYLTDQNEPTRYTLRPLRVIADATGVGRPVVDLIRHHLPTDVPVHAVTLTGTESFNRKSWIEWSCGKAWLVSRMQTLLQTGRLDLPTTKEGEALRDELLNYEIKASATGLETGAFRVGTHDDLATACGLAVLRPTREHLRPAPSWAR